MLEYFEKSEPKSSSNKSSAVPLNLFVVYEDCENISKEKLETFHMLVENISFDTKRARLDTGIAISCLTNRVREPDQSYWLKVVHMFK